jgi:hypothetical protein
VPDYTDFKDGTSGVLCAYATSLRFLLNLPSLKTLNPSEVLKTPSRIETSPSEVLNVPSRIQRSSSEVPKEPSRIETRSFRSTNCSFGRRNKLDRIYGRKMPESRGLIEAKNAMSGRIKIARVSRIGPFSPPP